MDEVCVLRNAVVIEHRRHFRSRAGQLDSPGELESGRRFNFYPWAGGIYLTVQISFVSASMSDGVCVCVRVCLRACML